MRTVNSRQSAALSQNRHHILKFTHIKSPAYTLLIRLIKLPGSENLITHFIKCAISSSTLLKGPETRPARTSSSARSSPHFFFLLGALFAIETPSNAPSTFLRLGSIAGFSTFKISCVIAFNVWLATQI